MINPYEILGLSNNATTEEIKSAYRRIAKTTHPDLNGGDESLTEKFREATAAYDFLMHDGNRQQYDYYTETRGEEDANEAYSYYSNQDTSYYKTVDDYIHEMHENIKEANESARVSLVFGVLMLLIMVSISFVSYVLADPGETFHIYYGALAIGAWCGIKSIYNFVKNKINVQKYEENVWEAIFGSKPAEDDEFYKAYKKSSEAKLEKRKTIRTVIVSIILIVVVAVMGWVINSGSTSTSELTTEEKLYEELMVLNEELTDMKKEIEIYETNLSDYYSKYEISGDDSDYEKYSDYYAEYIMYFDEYTKRIETFNEKYEYFDDTYGFAD